ncbi:hypothetical protein [Pseudonocardia dioxanivorans]|uniref:hypothetical protein n=1 Tax=Pseudonocardia dioxanivorans TaxID=240495 RepID=UPI0002FCC406|nr:hypothetical protein [Pseudonocardia dioxanivorans]
MSAVGVLIFMSLLGAFICAKVRVAGGAVAFSLMALVLFIATPVGQGLPEAIGSFVNAIDSASTPALGGDSQHAGVDQ